MGPAGGATPAKLAPGRKEDGAGGQGQAFGPKALQEGDGEVTPGGIAHDGNLPRGVAGVSQGLIGRVGVVQGGGVGVLRREAIIKGVHRRRQPRGQRTGQGPIHGRGAHQIAAPVKIEHRMVRELRRAQDCPLRWLGAEGLGGNADSAGPPAPGAGPF